MGPDRLGDGYKVYKQILWLNLTARKSPCFSQKTEISSIYCPLKFLSISVLTAVKLKEIYFCHQCPHYFLLSMMLSLIHI